MEDSVYYGEESVGRPVRPSRAVRYAGGAHVDNVADYDDDDDDDEDASCCQRCCRRCCRCFRSYLLTLLIVLATGAGIAVGAVLRFVPPFDNPREIPRIMSYLFFYPELKIRMMQFVVTPLVASSLISGLGAMQSSASGKIGLRAMTYYVCTSILAVGEGLGFIYAIRPGIRGTTPDITPYTPDRAPQDISKIDTLMDMFRNLIPDNFVKVAFESTQSVAINISGPNDTLIESTELESVPRPNLLGVVFFSMIFGLAVARAGAKGRVAYLFFDSVFESLLKLVTGLLWLYPLGIFCTMVHTVVMLKDPLGQLQSLFMFILTVILGLFAHACLVLPIVFVIFTRRNPFKHIYWCFRAIVTGFSTNNSNVTLPVTMDCLERSGISRRIIRAMCPIGATINMDGLALYEAMACVYIATIRGIQLGPLEIVAMAFTAVAVSIGAPTMGGGIATFILLFSTLGLPLQDIYILLPFDWMLARFRTVVNLWGDCVGTAVVEKCSKADLENVVPIEAEEMAPMDQGHPDGAVLTGYMPRQPKDWTVRLVNERGDKMCVSKV